jgi:hypothetical protein
MYNRLQGDQIRLIKLLPTQVDGRSATPLSWALACDMRTVSLRSPTLPPYVALSYSWGTDKLTEKINVSGEPLGITPNLFEALQALVPVGAATNAPTRGPDLRQFQNQYLWVDAICINQEDSDEKNHQVPLMSYIYSTASKTLMCLGKAAGESDLALDWLMHLTNIPGSFPGLSESTKASLWHVQAWHALCALIMRPYFRRRWIIEEAALSPEPWLQCGDKVLTWDRFYAGFERSAELYSRVSDRRLNVMTCDVESLVAIAILRYRLPRSINTSLFELLTRFRRCDTVKARDRVYAFMGLCREDELRENQVDYRAEIEDIFIRQVWVHIKTFNNLDILNASTEASRVKRRNTPYEAPDGLRIDPDDPAWARVDSTLRLPTWVPNWTSPRTQWLLGPETMTPSDPFKPIFNASDGIGAKVINLATAVQSGILRVNGVEVDTVRKVERTTPPPDPDQANPCSNFYRYCWDLCHELPLERTPYRTEGDRFDAFLRTICAGGRPIGGDCLLTIKFLRYFCLEFFQDPTNPSLFGENLRSLGYTRQAKPSHSEIYETAEAAAKFPPSEPPKILFNTLCAFKFFLSENGRMGLGPPHTQVGDKVCVLLGCSSPQVLHPSPHLPGHYCIRGEAYMHGLMLGEAIQMLRKGTLREQTFSLV